MESTAGAFSVVWHGRGPAFSGPAAGGIASSQAFGRPRAAAKGEFSFVQISDSHIGFSRPANRDVISTFERAVEKINALDRAPEFILHTGDLSHNAQADEPPGFTDRRPILANTVAIRISHGSCASAFEQRRAA